jgi:hypothetical protein
MHLQVTITNITKGQTFTPIMVAVHKPGVHIFELGASASVELEQLAEGGSTAPLEAALLANPLVKTAVDTGAALPPGQSVTITVPASGQFSQVSIAAMLIPTNDGFFAVDAVQTSHQQAITVFAPAYDAGTEMNDELCIHIPGGDGCSGEGFNPSRAGAEGYVHIHEGIHGIGDLPATTYDWRNPVALVTITPVP